MQKSKTHFEQIPVEVVKKIAVEVQEDDAGKVKLLIRTSPSKLKPHRSPTLEKNGKRV